MKKYVLWCGNAGSSLEVKIETDSNDAMEIKREAGDNLYAQDDTPSAGIFGFMMMYSLHSFLSL